ncbi:S-layer homology domain-containing protein [Gorillibacterium sp. sgz500922]|uniref:S-layer homology domain-containing protein n=1 Tax=Gorillibacterium sp. sgz500922 TaxID=3446694 RepID=UPI003F67ED96
MSNRLRVSLGLLLLAALAAGCKDSDSPKAEANSVPSASAATAVRPSSAIGAESASPGADATAAPAPGMERPRLKVEVVRPSQTDIAAQAADIAGHPREKAIEAFLKTGAVQLGADRAFHPDQPIKRGEFLQWLMKMDDKGVLPRDSETPSFRDVPRDHPLYRMVEGMRAAGVVAGYPDQTLRPDKDLTREEISVLWGMYIRKQSVSAPYMNFSKIDRNLISFYEDGDKVSDIFLSGVTVYFREQTIKDLFHIEKKIEPQKAVTRAEAADWITRLRPEEDEPDPSQEESKPESDAPSPSPEAPAGETNTVQITDIGGTRDEAALVRLLESGAVDVDAPGLFRPYDPVTKRDVLRWAAYYRPGAIQPATPATPTFSDLAPSDPDYALVEGLAAKGRLKAGSDGGLRLDEGLTRQELAQLWADYSGKDYSSDSSALSDGQIKLYGNSDGLLPELRKPVGAAILLGYYKKAFGMTPALGADLPVLRTEAAKWIIVYYDEHPDRDLP